jgi:hypothetical protein
MCQFSRRDVLPRIASSFVAGLGAMIAGNALPTLRPVHAKGVSATSRAKAKWMSTWMNSSNAKDVDGALWLGRFLDPMYFLLKPISWKPNPDQVGKYSEVDVPTGFVTDLASIPQIFYSLLRPDGNYAFAAIVHDYLYWTQPCPRATADEILKFGMQDLGVGTATIATIYSGVRVGGQSAWDDNAKLRSQGEKRVLVQFPDSPKILWADWKVRPGVFSSI